MNPNSSGIPAGARRRRLPEPMSSVLDSLPGAPTPGAVVDALVPACADLAWIAVPLDGLIRVCAFAHIDPLRLSAMSDFQRFYTPPLSDAQSFMSRVLRTARAELIRPDMLAEVEKRVSNPGTRAALTALGERTTLMAPIADAATPTEARAVLVTAMSSSGRRVDEDDLADLAQFAFDLSPRLHW